MNNKDEKLKAKYSGFEEEELEQALTLERDPFDDLSKVYYGAGPTIEVYDAETFKLQRVITLDGDSTTQLLVVRPQN